MAPWWWALSQLIRVAKRLASHVICDAPVVFVAVSPWPGIMGTGSSTCVSDFHQLPRCVRKSLLLQAVFLPSCRCQGVLYQSIAGSSGEALFEFRINIVLMACFCDGEADHLEADCCKRKAREQRSSHAWLALTDSQQARLEGSVPPRCPVGGRLSAVACRSGWMARQRRDLVEGLQAR